MNSRFPKFFREVKDRAQGKFKMVITYGRGKTWSNSISVGFPDGKYYTGIGHDDAAMNEVIWRIRNGKPNR